MLTLLRRMSCLLGAMFATTSLAAPTAPRWVQPIADAAPYQQGFGPPVYDQGPPWVRRPDGSGLLLLREASDSSVTVHGFDAAGTQTGIARIPDAGAWYQAPARWSGSDTANPWLIVESSASLRLLKFGPDASMLSNVDLAPRVIRYFHFLPNGGFLTSTPVETALYDAAGQQLWNAAVVQGVDYIHAISGLPDGSSWAALTTRADGTAKTQLRRVGVDGAELGRFDFACPTCATGYGPYLMALPDGSVAVAVAPDTLSRLSPTGDVLWTQTVDGTVRGLMNGPAGRLTVQLADSRYNVHDLQSGSLLWTHVARWFFPSTSGTTAVVHEPSHGLRIAVQRLDAGGQVITQEHVDLDDLGYDSFYAPTPLADGVELVASRAVAIPDSDGCFANPVVLRVVPGLSLDATARLCETPRSVSISAVERNRRGVLVHASFGLEAFDRDGRSRWRYEAPAQCRLDRYRSVRCPHVVAAAGTPDGGGWLLEGDDEEDDIFQRKADRIVRIAPDGIAAKFSLPSAPRIDDDRMLLLGSDRAVRLLWTADGWGSVGQLIFDVDGESRYQEIPLVDFAIPTLGGAVQHENGELTLAFNQWGWLLCLPVQPCEETLLIARIGAQGMPLWLSRSPWTSHQLLALGADGSAWIGVDYYSVQLVRIDPRGMATPVFPSPLPHRAYETVLLEPSAESVVHVGPSGAFRIGSAGQTLASTAWDDIVAGGSAPSARGILFNRLDAGLSLHSRIDFSLLAEFRYDPPADQRWEMRHLASHDDGSHFVARTSTLTDGRMRAELARFDEPGSPADLRVFADGLEP